ncbi:MAG: cytochrome bd-I oxidase subunit CydX [Parasulfuritortus sp.]|jgi:cyd operon protein YbgT|nr:cytochrome bd-I oxidase subunit CydX [Parasulfuritortus sp.]
MWYFTWILGASLAVMLAVLNGMLCEARECAVNNPEEDK